MTDSVWEGLARHENWQLSFDEVNAYEAAWCVYRVSGSINDREWSLIGIGTTPRDAVLDALSKDRKHDRR